MTRPILISIVPIILVVGACEHASTPAAKTSSAPPAATSDSTTAPKGETPAAPPAATANVGDALDVSVFELTTPGLFDTVRVVIDAKGDFSLAGTYKIRAAGLTSNEIEEKITEKLISMSTGLPMKGDPGPQVKVKLLGPAPVGATQPDLLP